MLLQQYDDGTFPAAYASKKLLKSEQNYSVIERELPRHSLRSQEIPEVSLWQGVRHINGTTPHCQDHEVVTLPEKLNSTSMQSRDLRTSEPTTQADNELL